MCSMTTTASTTSETRSRGVEDAAPRGGIDEHVANPVVASPSSAAVLPPSPFERFTTVTSACLPPLEALPGTLEGDALQEIVSYGQRAGTYERDPPPPMAGTGKESDPLDPLPAFQDDDAYSGSFNQPRGEVAPDSAGNNNDWLETTRVETASARSQSEAKWPRKGIATPHPNDVLYGRGGGTNHHPGNKRYRKMVEERKHRYVNSKRLEKPLIAFEIIRIWRAQDPPGRFLKKDKSSGLWNDVGDAQARKKTSQALREQAPLIRELGSGELLDADADFDLGFDMDEDDGAAAAPVPAESPRDGQSPAFLGDGAVESSSEFIAVPRGELGAEEDDVVVEQVLVDEECNVGPTSAVVTTAIASSSSLPPMDFRGDQPDWSAYSSAQLMVSEAEGSGVERTHSFGPREHSLGEYPLEFASVTQSAIDAAFDRKMGSWATRPNYFAIAKEPSVTLAAVAAPVPGSTLQPNPAVSASYPASFRESSEYPSSLGTASSAGMRSASLASEDTTTTTGSSEVCCAKDAIKRATSHQNETFETKRYLVGPSVKRAAMSRGGTFGTLNSQPTPTSSGPDGDDDSANVAPCIVGRRPLNDDLEMRELTQSMEKSSIDWLDIPSSRSIGAKDRMLSVEIMSSLEWLDLPHSRSIGAIERATSIDHIAMDLMVNPVAMSRTNTEEIFQSLSSDVDVVRRLLGSDK